jgi:hypothetical protein
MPDERPFHWSNLQCGQCGNATSFSMDLKHRFDITVSDGKLEVELQKHHTERIFDVLGKSLEKLLERGWEGKSHAISCGNCGESEWLDFQERTLDSCDWSGCCGCFHCGNYIPESQVRELCTDCINQKKGDIDSDSCWMECPNADNSLLEVLDYYGLSVEKLKRELGYDID